MNELYNTENRKQAILAVAIIDQLGGTLDEIFWTPLRDIQVFAQKSFNNISGINHPLIASLLVSASIVTNFAYVAKVFNKNKAESLEEVLRHCHEELHQNYFEVDGLISDKQLAELTTYFKKDLEHKGYDHLDVEVKFDPIKKNYNLQYKFSGTLTKILKQPDLTFEAIERDYPTLEPSTKAFLRKMISGTKTIGESRKKFLKKLHKIKKSDALKTTYDVAADVSFQFWLVFFVSDMMYNNADSMKWNIRTQLITLGVALSISAVKFGAKVINFFKRKNEDEKKNHELNTQDGKPIEYVNESLQHKQYESFFIRQLRKRNLEKARKKHLPAQAFAQEDVNSVKLREKPLYKKMRNQFFSIFSSVEDIEDVIKGEIEDKSSFVQKATAVKTVADMSIMVSFIEWVAGAAVYAFSKAKSVKTFLDGTQGGIVGLVAFGLGAIVGVAYYNKKIKPELEKDKAALKAEFESPEHKTKLALLKQFAQENKKFRQLIKDNHLVENGRIKKLSVMKSYDERKFRRVTAEKANASTYAKKIVNRSSLIVGRVGTGILLVRFTILATLALTLSAAAFAAVLWPVAVVALAIGCVWAGFFLYKYVQERRIAHAKAFLEDIDNRLEAEKDANDAYRTQFQLEHRSEQFKTETEINEKGFAADSESETEDSVFRSDEESSESLSMSDKESSGLKKENENGGKTQKTLLKPELPKIVEKEKAFFEPTPHYNNNLVVQYGGPGFFSNAYSAGGLAHPQVSTSPQASTKLTPR